MIRGFSGETAPENVNPNLIGATAYSFVASGPPVHEAYC
jgi:hypothetical protein